MSYANKGSNMFFRKPNCRQQAFDHQDVSILRCTSWIWKSFQHTFQEDMAASLEKKAERVEQMWTEQAVVKTLVTTGQSLDPVTNHEQGTAAGLSDDWKMDGEIGWTQWKSLTQLALTHLKGSSCRRIEALRSAGFAACQRNSRDRMDSRSLKRRFKLTFNAGWG